MSAVRDWAIFSLGLAAGAGLALAYAPQTGEETRKQVTRNLEDASDYVKDASGEFRKHAKRALKNAKGSVKDMTERASSMAQGVTDRAKDLI